MRKLMAILALSIILIGCAEARMPQKVCIGSRYCKNIDKQNIGYSC